MINMVASIEMMVLGGSEKGTGGTPPKLGRLKAKGPRLVFSTCSTIRGLDKKNSLPLASILNKRKPAISFIGVRTDTSLDASEILAA